VEPGYHLFGVIKIEYTQRLPGRLYPHEYSYLAMYAGRIKELDPFNGDPAGIILERALFTFTDCERHLLDHDKILMREGITALARHRDLPELREFLGESGKESGNGRQRP
jgi:hypothetical protein